MSNLDKVLGNRRIKDYITRAVRLNRISHSYMIEGEKGSGKKMLAECFSRILQCEGEGELDCGVCTSCRQVDHGNHPDVIHVVHEKPNTITVNDVREQIVNTADILPYKAPYKIYIIDEAEKMNDEAQNALLKTIEEPPSYVIIFLLVTSRGAMLETIQSRCVLLPAAPVAREDILTCLKDISGQGKRDLTDDQLSFAAGYAMGNVGKALEAISSEDFETHKEEALQILRNVQEGTSDQLAAFAKTIVQDKMDAGLMLDLFLVWYRDLLVLKAGDLDDRIIFREEEITLEGQARCLSFRALDTLLREIARTRDRLRANVNAEAAILLLLIRMHQEYTI